MPICLPPKDYVFECVFFLSVSLFRLLVFAITQKLMNGFYEDYLWVGIFCNWMTFSYNINIIQLQSDLTTLHDYFLFNYFQKFRSQVLLIQAHLV